MSKSILQVSVDLPYPPNDGYRLDVWNRLTALKKLGHRVHLLIMQPTTTLDTAALQYVKRHVDRFQIVPRLPLLRSLIAVAPTLAKRNTPLMHFRLSGPFDVVIAESEHVASVFDNPAVASATHVLRMHNDEAAYMLSLAHSEQRTWKRLFFYFDSIRYRRYSPAVIGIADRIWAISAKEYQNLINSHIELKSKLRWLPPTLPFTPGNNARKPAPGSVLFVGNLRGPINQDALNWYLDNVHIHLLDRTDYHLIVAGNTTSRGRTDSRLEIVDRINHTERCTLFANLSSLSHLYTQSSVFINPMQRGAGVKLKTVEAAAAGIPIVSTSIGNEGTGLLSGRHIQIANSGTEFVNAIEELLSDSDTAEMMASAAFDVAASIYSYNALEAQIVDATGG